MGYVGKLDLKIKAIHLRQQGFSYQEILEKVQVSKDTLSRWCRDIILTPEQLARLKQLKLAGGKKGGEIGAHKKRILRKKKTEDLYKKGKEEIGILSDRDRFIAGLSLYLGDGLKSDREVGFANSYPQLIKFIVEWLRTYCKVKPGKFRGQLWIHDTCDEKAAKEFWSNLTKIPLEQFLKSYVALSKKDSPKVRKQLHQYGVFSVRVFSAETQRRILGWGTGIFG